jgi:hypothetical protein
MRWVPARLVAKHLGSKQFLSGGQCTADWVAKGHLALARIRTSVPAFAHSEGPAKQCARCSIGEVSVADHGYTTRRRIRVYTKIETRKAINCSAGSLAPVQISERIADENDGRHYSSPSQLTAQSMPTPKSVLPSQRRRSLHQETEKRTGTCGSDPPPMELRVAYSACAHNPAKYQGTQP